MKSLKSIEALNTPFSAELVWKNSCANAIFGRMHKNKYKPHANNDDV